MGDGFNLMKNSDPSECFKRIICDVATGEKEYSTMTPFLNFVSDDEDQFVPKELEVQVVLTFRLFQAYQAIQHYQDFLVYLVVPWVLSFLLGLQYQLYQEALALPPLLEDL